MKAINILVVSIGEYSDQQIGVAYTYEALLALANCCLSEGNGLKLTGMIDDEMVCAYIKGQDQFLDFMVAGFNEEIKERQR